jgi:uncharacterized linocin/CFP29 family protein
MDHLLRELAPISDAAWLEIEREAKRSLVTMLAARKLVDVEVQDDWTTSAMTSGRVTVLEDAALPGVSAQRRESIAVTELRAELVIERTELDAIDRGAPDADLQAVVDAARAMAFAEDSIVFNGLPGGSALGICPASPHEPVSISDDYNSYPTSVARAVAMLRAAAVDGPYGIALGPRCYTGVIETTEHGGYPVLEHLRLILGGPVVWAPAVDGAVVLSMRTGDFELSIGHDLAIGYVSHDLDHVQLVLEETVAFRANTPVAAVHLTY